VDEDIQLKFDIRVRLNELQTKFEFEFRYAWPTFDWIIPLDINIYYVFRTFVCPGSSGESEIF
jgi:hypothetical protein